ncbi:UDP-N-acetylmuramoyl-L-alanyl-D-glutamate--2,6-diaminopimelate ligase [Galactobacter valiniphilus]|uniref:UDP-N-acetylmuramyl-tripeptide synthetase n=1 Tax=Galactobacter valiniphilus TaxID=2676122 RepID=A0A399JBP0_9MICC|nr:UDP-N-acetylmuramoyl-L-alanyl-D-glutamate--2,6-diaminopimelate ligase [Galactobacter valiniphilus]RII42958.1 UDP-N-acetylmuramoyl-L-alanyl-D-glutamate--2,6-diaminopimelate ligase [Galactobacter valiniphilus]
MSTAPQAPDPHTQMGEAERAFRPSTPPSVGLDAVLDAAGPGASLTPASAVAATVSGVCLDSRAVQPGDLYAALPGARVHGASFAPAAVAAGAAAILTDADGAAVLGGVGLPVIEVPEPRAVLGAVAAAVYGTRADAPRVLAVTGTNGKTTTTYLLRSLLGALGRTTGLVGTIEILAGDTPIPSVLTTPEAPQLHALMARMREAGVQDAAMEVSSHSLEFRRVAGLRYAVSGFTNLTQDHLDLHGTMEEYLAAKAKLFTPEYSDAAVVSIDDEWGEAMAGRSREAGVRTVTLATHAGVQGADWSVVELQREGLGHRFGLVHRDGRRLDAVTGLPGDFNVSNAALALAMLLESGVEIAALQGLVADAAGPLTPSVPGRMQVIATSPTAIVDFAHNPDAIVRALESVRTDAGRTIVVFGATGERDTSKRPIMGELAARNADVVIVTDDDPHGEGPADIRAQVLAGARAAAGPDTQVLEVAPRAAAIAEAARLAGPHDVILVAGRGHEVWQEVAGVNLALDDREELRQALAAAHPDTVTE